MKALALLGWVALLLPLAWFTLAVWWTIINPFGESLPDKGRWGKVGSVALIIILISLWVGWFSLIEIKGLD